jgi:hypothetical protein
MQPTHTPIKVIQTDGILREFTGHPHQPHYTIYEHRAFLGSYTDWRVYYHVPAAGVFGTTYYLGRGTNHAEARLIRDAHQAAAA